MNIAEVVYITREKSVHQNICLEYVFKNRSFSFHASLGILGYFASITLFYY